MQQHPRLFDTVYCTLIKAGETVGQPGAVLERLADFNEARQRMRSKLMQALIYPSLLTTVAILVVVILLTAVVPKVAAQFVHLKHALPLTTRTLLAISHFLSAYGPWILLIAAAVGGSVLILAEAGRKPASLSPTVNPHAIYRPVNLRDRQCPLPTRAQHTQRQRRSAAAGNDAVS